MVIGNIINISFADESEIPWVLSYRDYTYAPCDDFLGSGQ